MHQLIIKNILIIYILMSSSDSPQALSDPLPRIYSCFCDKIFTTYPGIYLHLKSKHSNLFQKYKKLKITKLFKKIKGEDNSEIFKLDKLSQRDIANSNFYLKKIKQNNKKINVNSDEKIVQIEDQSDDERIRKRNNYGYNNGFEQRPTDMSYGNKFFSPSPRDFLERMGNNPYYPPMPNPFFGFPFCPPPQTFPPPFAPYLDPPIKRLLQEFLVFSQANGVSSKTELRDVLYKMMIFIDENYPAVSDPRVKDEVLLSYCDLFSPKFIGPLLTEYITHKECQMENGSQSSEITYLKQFVSFLKERRLLKSESEQKLESKSQQAPKNIHTNHGVSNQPTQITQRVASDKIESLD